MKKVLFDTSALVSAIAFDGKPGDVLGLIPFDEDLDVYITETVLSELNDVFRREKLVKYYEIFSAFLEFIEVFPDAIRILKDSTEKVEDEEKIKGINDQLIYRTAINNNIDILITGDNHFLKNNLKGIRILNINNFIIDIENSSGEDIRARSLRFLKKIVNSIKN